ncbi:hypothetical protein F5B19DRAFT_256510 [Rostrohypoxylon terebratum]|nr:hypothetical protein F5B19DRAFT_256510 [Rostrohypoxylon terebratum]
MTSQDIKIVDSLYFSEVLRHFDENGNVIDENTSFQIQCIICHDKKLAITNPKLDQKSEETHESYVVLHLCGHAFGSSCLVQWVYESYNLTCPVCRQPIFNGRIPQDTFQLLVFRGRNAESQKCEIHALKDMVNFRTPRPFDYNDANVYRNL